MPMPMPMPGRAVLPVLCCVLACCLPTLPTCRSEVRGTASSTGAGCFVYLLLLMHMSIS